MRNIALALGLISLVTAAHAAPPLLQEGKKTLYQRVLTTPGCALHEAPGGKPGAVQPTFSRFYVYAGKDEAGKSWVQVGPDSFGKTLGWLDRSCTVDWRMQMSLAFTNPAGRDRMLFFKDRSALDAVFNAIDPVEKIAPVRQQLKTKGQAPGIVAQEPELFVDMAKNFYLLPILGGEEVMTEQNMRVRVLNVASVSAADAVDSAKAGQDQSTAHERTKQIKEFSSAVVFVIDSTISMDPTSNARARRSGRSTPRSRPRSWATRSSSAWWPSVPAPRPCLRWSTSARSTPIQTRSRMAQISWPRWPS